MSSEVITIVVDEKLCKHYENGFCMKTIDKPYGPWSCEHGLCNFSTTMEAKKMNQEELDSWVEKKKEEFRREYDQLKK